LACNFSGQVWPVHPSASSIFGLPAVPRLADLPHRPDAVVIAVPAATAVEVVREASDLGIPGAVVLASGFAETGAAGGLLQQALAASAVAGNMALCGPNCLGLYVPATGLALFSSRLVPDMRRGHVAIVSHSGATAIALANCGRLGVSHVVSAGNAAVTDIADYMTYFATTDTVRVVALLLEKIPNPGENSQPASLCPGHGASPSSQSQGGCPADWPISSRRPVYRRPYGRVGRLQ